MKLKKLEITHFRCFESLSIELHPEVNVIVGANGAGKTSILDSIAIALYQVVAANGGGGRRQREQQKANLLPSDILIENGASEALSGRRDFVQFRATAESFYSVEGFPTTAENGSAAQLEWTEHIQYQPPAGFHYGTTTSERSLALHRYFRTLWAELRISPWAMIPLPMVAYYRASRRAGAMPELGDAFSIALTREAAYSGALDAGANFKTMCQWFYLRENAELRARLQHEGQNFEYADLLAVRVALGKVIENVEQIFFDGTPPQLKVRLSIHGDTQTLELAQLSDGYRNLLALVLDYARRLAQANPNWPNPLEAPGILIIDEIELHLHPSWQQKVIPALREAFPNTQLILSTHSPAVLTTVRREHIHLLGGDHRFEQISDEVGTYGAESSRVLAEVFGTHVRPPNIESVEKLRTYLALIEGGAHQTDAAQALRAELEDLLGKSDPDLRRADIRAQQLRILAQR